MIDIQSIIDDLDAGQPIDNSVVRSLCKELSAYREEHSSQIYLMDMLDRLRG